MTEAAGIIAAAKPGFKPKVGVILGSRNEVERVTGYHRKT